MVLTLRAPELCQTGGGFGSDTGPNGFDGEARSYPSGYFEGGSDEFEYRVCP
jgi:hypothetical protein